MADRRAPNAPDDPLIGQTLGGRYEVMELVDRGGMGKVYRAVQQPLGRTVALKTLDLVDPRGEFQQRFFNEASIASRLTHPNTVRVFDYGRSDDGIYFLTMEFLQGQTLHKLIKSQAPLDPQRVIAIARQVCGALHEAHETGIVHRDLKPGNVFLTSHGDDLEFAKVLDFGLVKDLESDVRLSQTGQALGSPLYMSPEQVEGDPVDRRSDIYALGLVLYVALCGKVPFKKGSVATIMMQQVTKTVPLFEEITPDVPIPGSIEWIVRRCIEKDPKKRFATMREVSTALKLAGKELRNEYNSIPWKLNAEGHLDLPEEYLKGEETFTGSPPPMEAPVGIPDMPSSPTLNRSAVTPTVVVAGGGLFVFIVLGLAVATLLVAGIIGLAVLGSAEAPQPEVIHEAPPVEAPPPRPTEDTVAVVLESDPTGAEVLDEGRFIGTTPLTVKIGGPKALTLQSDGYASREVMVDGSQSTFRVPLSKKRVTKAATPVPTQPTAPKSAPLADIRDPWANE